MVAKSIVSKKKQQAKKAKTNNMKKEFMAQCVRHIAAKILDAEMMVGRTPHGIAKKLLLEGQECFPEMNMNMINYAVKKLTEEESGIVERLENNSKLGTVIAHGGRSSMSSLSDDVTGAKST
jgi:hypothetical protein